LRKDALVPGDNYVSANVELVEGSPDTEIIVSQTFECPDISEVNELNVLLDFPVADEEPDATPTAVLTHYCINKVDDSDFINNLIRWENVTDGYILNENSTFELGKVYRAYMQFKPTNGYQFAESPTVKFGAVTATIETASSNFISAYADYTLSETVDNVDLTVDVNFLAGKAPCFFANSEESEKYISYDYNEDYFESGVCYKDITADEFMQTGSNPFFQGHEYAITVAVKCTEAHKFAPLNDMTASINGIEAVASSISPFAKQKTGVRFFTATLGDCTTDINDCKIVISSRAKYIYNGSKQKLSLNITDGSYVLKEGTDFEVLYMGNRTNVGKVNYEISGLGEYSGSKSGSFKITAKAMSSAAKINISTKSYTYNGKVKQPTVSVYDGSKKLKKNTDYTVSYSNTKSKYVGEYSIKVSFKGNYSGSKSVTYTIVPKGTTLLKTASTGKDYISPQWKKQTSQTTGYEIMYSKSAGFKSGNKTVAISKNTQTIKKITGLKKNTKYYFKVRTYKTVKVSGRNKKFYSSWSPVKEFKTKKK
ncbi:MAG: fibronectin type III domain-containing protein, partial [Eubacterium sp.]|nr:fibronectin type III domain-containing protein [Eubacterium sp.]